MLTIFVIAVVVVMVRQPRKDKPPDKVNFGQSINRWLLPVAHDNADTPIGTQREIDDTNGSAVNGDGDNK